MKDREKIRQSVLELGRDGKVFTLEDVLKIDGVAVGNPEENHFTLRKTRARNYMRYVYSSEGLTLRSVGANNYKVIDVESEEECQLELKKLRKKQHSLEERIENHKKLMLAKGYPVQVEMKEMMIEEGEVVAQGKAVNSIRSVIQPSKKPKKAAGH